MIDAVESALKRLEVDVKVARENWDSNPFLSMAALMDLQDGTEVVTIFLESDPEAISVAEALGVPGLAELKGLLHEAYEANGVDLSHFGKDDGCAEHESSNEGLPNPYNSSGLPPEVMALVEKLAGALGATDVQVVLPDSEPDKV